jgi:hypothetical protein
MPSSIRTSEEGVNRQLLAVRRKSSSVTPARQRGRSIRREAAPRLETYELAAAAVRTLELKPVAWSFQRELFLCGARIPIMGEVPLRLNELFSPGPASEPQP